MSPFQLRTEVSKYLRLLQLVQIQERLRIQSFVNFPLPGVVEKSLECGRSTS